MHITKCIHNYVALCNTLLGMAICLYFYNSCLLSLHVHNHKVYSRITRKVWPDDHTKSTGWKPAKLAERMTAMESL